MNASDELQRLQSIEQAATELLPFLPPASAHNIPANNLRFAMGLLSNEGDKESWVTMLGKRIRAARLAKRLSMDRLAERAGLSKTGLWQIETGKSEPGAWTLHSLLSVLEISADELLRG